MSLTRRLVVVLVVLSGLGLAILALVSYAALSSYLSNKLDAQARQSAPVAGRLLSDESGLEPGPPDEPGEGPGGPVDAQLPDDTYAELRSQAGEVLSSKSFSLDESTVSPELPGDISVPAEVGATTVFDAPPSSGDGSGFRVAAQTGPKGTVALVAIPERAMDETLERLRTIEILVSLAVLAALAGLGVWAVRVGLRPLSRIEETAGEIAAGNLSRRVEETDQRTEVGRLGVAFNEMLGRLEHAFAEQRASEERLRRFLADASHELRTPLSSIRGYAELFRIGAAADPDDLARSMNRIEQESERMGGIVEDLLALARMDEVREAQHEPLDLAKLTAEVSADIAAANPDRSITVEAGDAVHVAGDEDQLRRLVSNLLTNAMVHGRDRVEVRVGQERGQALLEVRDHGPGLAPGSERKVFERLWRADPARGRARGGAGLGLAIVEAVAAAHGGTAVAENAAGGGARFTVRVPLVA